MGSNPTLSALGDSPFYRALGYVTDSESRGRRRPQAQYLSASTWTAKAIFPGKAGKTQPGRPFLTSLTLAPPRLSRMADFCTAARRHDTPVVRRMNSE